VAQKSSQPSWLLTSPFSFAYELSLTARFLAYLGTLKRASTPSRLHVFLSLQGKEKKEKPTWNQPGDKKKKEGGDSEGAAAEKKTAKGGGKAPPPSSASAFVNTTPKGHKKDVRAAPMDEACACRQ
jgi:hypothetical protein